MGPGQDPMGAPTSFTARRPNAHNLPAFELPPPPVQLSQHQKYASYSHPAPATTLTSVGNLLTPPSNGSTDGISPASSNPLPSSGAVQPFTPNGSGMWPPSTTSSSSYGYSSAGSAPHFSGQGRGLFSPSLNSIVRGSNSPTASEALPPPPYDMQSSYASSMPMSAPAAPAHQHMMVSAPVSQPSPVHSQESFARPPPTPTTSYYSQQSSTPQQGSFSYSTGPSPIAQSPISAGGPLGKMSPVNQQGPVPSIHQQQPQQAYAQHRPYSYPMPGPGPVLSNVHNPSMVGGMPHGMVPHFNSGHAAQMHHLYGQHPPNPQNDRPFRCDQCPQSFNRNHDLKRHKRIHLAVKPFPCGHCDKSFSRKDALKRHVLVKGCGKAGGASAEVKELDGSQSPETKSESVGHSPVISAHA
ncbi:Zinc finger protein [Pseudocercospora fuligena]|uniref:Zinc finger protein n=1 Tax=Pseudocercospora fuligena TaxID=685502 RepID=A0A8H6RAL8_9PEZI|nr:Zinc finger protein [Pseudocercospora fuligena]